MADGSQILFRLRAGQFCIADIIFTVAGRKAHALCQLQGLFQRSFRPRAKGCARLRLPLHTVDGHQSCNVRQDLLLVGRNECVDLLIQCLIHDCSIVLSFGS